MTIFRFAVLRGIRNPISLLLNFAIPLGLIFVAPLWQEGGLGYYLMAMLFMYGSFVMSRGILSDKMDGTIIRILSAPVTTLQYLFQNLLASMVPIVAQLIIVCAVGFVLYNWSIAITFLLWLCYTVFAVASVTFSFAWSCLFKSREISYAIFSTLMSVVAIISGFWIPLSLLPRSIRIIGALFPSYWTSVAIETLLEHGASGEYWLSLAAVLLFAVAYLLYGGKRRIT